MLFSCGAGIWTRFAWVILVLIGHSVISSWSLGWAGGSKMALFTSLAPWWGCLESWAPFPLHVVARPLLVVSPAAQDSRHVSQEKGARNYQCHKAKASELAQGHLHCVLLIKIVIQLTRLREGDIDPTSQIGEFVAIFNLLQYVYLTFIMENIKHI